MQAFRNKFLCSSVCVCVTVVIWCHLVVFICSWLTEDEDNEWYCGFPSHFILLKCSSDLELGAFFFLSQECRHKVQEIRCLSVLGPKNVHLFHFVWRSSLNLFCLLKVVDKCGYTPWPKVWLLGVLDIKMAQRGRSLHPDQKSENQAYFCFLFWNRFDLASGCLQDTWSRMFSQSQTSNGFLRKYGLISQIL